MRHVWLALTAAVLGCSEPSRPSVTGLWRGLPADQSVLWTLNLADNDGEVNGCAESVASAASGFGTTRYGVSGTHSPPHLTLELANTAPTFSGSGNVTLTAEVTQDTMMATLAGRAVRLTRSRDNNFTC